MKKNENIFISLEIQKNLDSKGLSLNVQFDRNAPNFLEDNQVIRWCPTGDELDFITEAFALIGGNKNFMTVEKKEENEDHPEENEAPSQLETSNYSHRSSEIRIAPLPNNMTMEDVEETGRTQSGEKEYEEKVFVQADEKKIDEILKRKKQMVKEQYSEETDEKALVDRMMKQKKKR
jgi:hypothetical protein